MLVFPSNQQILVYYPWHIDEELLRQQAVYLNTLCDDLKQFEILENVTVPSSVSLFTAEKAGRCISACVVLYSSR